MGRARALLRSPVVQFGVTGLVAVVIVAVVVTALVVRESTHEALRDAENVTRVSGEAVVGPALTPAVLRGDRSALRRLDALVRRRLLRSPVVRVKVWRGDGTILYSDEPRLIGERYALGDEEREALQGRTLDAELSDVDRPENRFERGFHRLREVYLGIEPAAGGPHLLFEEYLRDSSIDRSGTAIWRRYAPIILGAFLLLALVQLPLAASLGRRLRRGQREREALLRRAIAASETERRRIARDLHDGVVQELAGVSYALSSAGAQVGHEPERARDTVDEAGAQVRRSIRQLRSMLVELYPPVLHRQGLHPALTDLLVGLEQRDVHCELHYDGDLRIDADHETLLYRGAQEALRNVAAHAHASTVRLSVRADNGAAVLEVSDDGDGFDPVDDGRPRFGLAMLSDLLAENDGRLELRSEVGSGTTVRLTVPRRR